MKMTYQYRLRPTNDQIAKMNNWLELLRRQYNYRLAQRLDWWQYNRCDINACPLTCSIAPLADKPNYNSQQNDLPNSKILFPEYKDIHSQVLQNSVKRVELAYDRFVAGDSNGKRSGKPRSKGKGRYRSFTYTQMKQTCIVGNRITLPKIGSVKLVVHRAIPNGFKIKTATVSCKADGWHVALTLEDVTVPESRTDLIPSLDNTVGIDLGLKSFLTTSNGEEVEIPQHYRLAHASLQKLQQKLQYKKNKSSKRRQKAVKRLGKQHQKIANQRKDFHHKTANWLLEKGEVIAYEDLKVKNMSQRCKPKQDEDGRYLPNGQSRKAGLNKSILDAGWSAFITILGSKAERAGLLVVAVNPSGTSQDCSACGVKVPKLLKDRWHSCSNCGLELDRDHNAAMNIKQRSVGHPVKAEKLNARRGKPRREAHSIPFVG